ncbi:chymotrypsin BI [Dendroctonus ponderosae]
MSIWLIFGSLLGVIEFSQQQLLTPLTKTSPELFPYQVYVEADLYCLGALISTRFVVVNAICIESRNHAEVHLGTESDPFYNIFGTKGQVIKASELLPHPEFGKRYTDHVLVNNIGLIKLRDPAILTSKVQPIKLPSKYDFPLLPGTLLNVTGYMDSIFMSDILRFMTVKVRPQEQCQEFYGKDFMTDVEQCVEATGRRIDWPGVFAMDGKLVGLARELSRSIDCVVSDSSCSKHDVFLSIGPYLDWIYENSDVPRTAPLVRIIRIQQPQFVPKPLNRLQIVLPPSPIIVPELVNIHDREGFDYI